MRNLLSNYLKAQKRRQNEAILRRANVSAGGVMPVGGYVLFANSRYEQWVEAGATLPAGARISYKYGA